MRPLDTADLFDRERIALGAAAALWPTQDFQRFPSCDFIVKYQILENQFAPHAPT
jgi:hypothetical protein